jgi:hypothetical protein
MKHPSEAFLEVMCSEAGWHWRGRWGTCDRCGTGDTNAVSVEGPCLVWLALCAACERLVVRELEVQRRPALVLVYRRAMAAALLAARRQARGARRRDAGNP